MNVIKSELQNQKYEINGDQRECCTLYLRQISTLLRCLWFALDIYLLALFDQSARRSNAMSGGPHEPLCVYALSYEKTLTLQKVLKTPHIKRIKLLKRHDLKSSQFAFIH